MIPKTEISKRWELIRNDLAEVTYDALLVPLGTNFYYLFGKQSTPSERLIAGVLPVDSDPFIIGPAFEQSNIQRSTGLDDIVPWEETESPYHILAKELNDRRIGNKIAVDPKLWIVEAERIQEASNRSLQSAGSILDRARSIKSNWELEQMAKASESSAKGILDAFDKLQEGITEKELARIVATEMMKYSGNPMVFGAIQFGENSAIPHAMPSEKKLRQNEVVLIDAGTSVNGYQGDITITSTFGKVAGFEEIYDVVYEANRKALDSDKEGIVAGNLDGIARKHIEDKGYGQYFTHRLGHGLGLEVHEAPYIVSTNTHPLIAGNTHTIEPGIYQPGKFGIRIEDDVVVHKGKAKLLFDTPRFNFR
ncbi:MAG: aminopeptidase P family protein [Candidatus Heimdallarchaeota archaeon]|nr:aminopeptidase P family protein [Candidatus Heimdallarchaeota archaeon]